MNLQKWSDDFVLSDTKHREADAFDTPEKAAIFAKLASQLGKIEVFHNKVLVATYIAAEKTSGGIYLPESVRDEDRFQGKVGLVLKKGPLAFQDSESVTFSNQNVEVGEWVFYRTSDGFQLNVRDGSAKIHCRILDDVDIKGVLASPDVVW